MRHFLILASLAGLVAWLVLKPSTLDKLSAPPPAGTGPAESGFVEVPPERLPVKPGYFSVPNHTTVVIFHDDRCPGCIKLDRDMQDFMHARPDVAVRKIRVDLNALDQAIRNYGWNIYATPCVLIYDRKGKLVVADEKLNTAGEDLLYEWLNREAALAARKAG